MTGARTADTASTLEADVVVIGGGGSGLAAAIEAASLGRRVVLLEKADQVGGTTGMSVGSITATNTPQQLRRGILDSPQDHLEDLRKFNQPAGLPDNDALARLLVENVPDTVRWLMGMGVEFFGPVNELPHRKPRMHVALPNSRAYIYHLSRRARTLGVDIRTSVRAAGFIKEAGRVTGVRCDTAHGPLRVYARGGVVLCSGDYSASPDKRERYLGERMTTVTPINPHNTGDGHDMVEALGGRILNRQHFLAGIRFQAPPRKWIHHLPPHRWLTRCMRFMLERMPGGLVRPFVMSFLTTILVPSPKLLQQGAILVNRQGERFGDELDAPGPRIAQQPDQLAYLVMDAKLAARFNGWPNYVSTAPGFAYASVADYRRNRKDIFHEAGSIEELAARLGMPAQALARSVEAFNRTCASADGQRKPLDRGPYIALGPVRYLINFTDGGVAVSNDLEVLGAEGRPIPGLYAAGFTGMGGMLLEGHGHHLGWAFTSGRLAGRRAAHNVVTPTCQKPPRPGLLPIDATGRTCRDRTFKDNWRRTMALPPTAHNAHSHRPPAPGRRHAVVWACVATMGIVMPLQADAQGGAAPWPTKPVKLVVAYAAGGTIDLAARRIADDLGAELGQPVVVENRGGANGIPASEFVARSPADGHTILFTSLPAHAGNKSAYKKLPYDTVADFIPVTVLAYQPLVLVAHPSVPANNIAELIKLAKERPGQVSYASFGVGGLAHLAAVQLNQLGGTTMNHVPYKGGGPALADVMGGHVNLYFSGVTTTLPLLAEGKLKALGVSSAKRVKSLPNVPTIAETPGFRDFEAVVPPIMLVPAKTPAAVVARLHAATYKVTHSPEQVAKLEKAGEGEVLTSTPEVSMQMLKKEIDRLAVLFKSAGVEPE